MHRYLIGSLLLLASWSIVGKVQTDPVEELVSLLTSTDHVVAERARQTLITQKAEIKNQVVAKLIPLLVHKNDGNNAIPRLAADALMKTTPEAAIQALPLLSNDNRYIRGVAVEVIGSFLGEFLEAKDILLNTLKNDTSPFVKGLAVRQLGNISSPTPDVVASLIAALDDRHITMNAVYALGNIGPDASAAVPTLNALLIRYDAEKHRIKWLDVAATLGKIGPKARGSIANLVSAFTHGDSRTRRSAAEALAAIGIDAVPALLEALQSNSIQVRLAASEALAGVRPKSEQVVTTLIKTLQDENIGVQKNAVSGLRSFASHEALAALARYDESLERAALTRKSWLIKPHSRDEITAVLSPNNQHKYPAKLVNSYEFGSIFVTHHKGDEYEERVNFWQRNKGRYFNLKSLLTNSQESYSFYGKLMAFNALGKQIIHLPLLFHGSGHNRRDYFFCVTNENTLRGLPYRRAAHTYRSQLNAGEGIWKGESIKIEKNKLSFEFYIWNRNDANCCPTAGRVTGEYEVIDSTGQGGCRNMQVRSAGFVRHGIKH